MSRMWQGSKRQWIRRWVWHMWGLVSYQVQSTCATLCTLPSRPTSPGTAVLAACLNFSRALFATTLVKSITSCIPSGLCTSTGSHTSLTGISRASWPSNSDTGLRTQRNAQLNATSHNLLYAGDLPTTPTPLHAMGHPRFQLNSLTPSKNITFNSSTLSNMACQQDNLLPSKEASLCELSS